ncbi:MAG: Na+/H+ antiporter subunit E [Candidatus Omnitrophica bacterium]|nr:Na+/H+ antiporter subunit E [Candidatus Omnitrophota bacterium]MBU1366595.1 Na+/H+ antiporter subunit E [Candidatus Omnitrophota bacterium]
MGSKIILFLAAFLVWSVLSWVPDFQHLIVGVFVAALVAFLTGDLFVSRPYILKRPRRYWYFIAHYLPVFLWEMIKANIDVAYRVLHPDLPINPGIVRVKTSLKSDTALTFLANSITLTPGTMSVDIDKDNGVLYIHWINVRTKDTQGATKIIVQRFEKILKKIFD